MSTIQQDFDRIALVSDDGATQNDHISELPASASPRQTVMTAGIGCGKAVRRRSGRAFRTCVGS